MKEHIIKQYETVPLEELANQPVFALSGLSESDAEALKKHLGIETIADLATNRFVLSAQRLVEEAQQAGAEEAHLEVRPTLLEAPQPGPNGESLPPYALCQYSQALRRQQMELDPRARGLCASRAHS
jgi:hypothetical protein